MENDNTKENDINAILERLEQKDIVIDALRHEITSLKEKLRHLEEGSPIAPTDNELSFDPDEEPVIAAPEPLEQQENVLDQDVSFPQEDESESEEGLADLFTPSEEDEVLREGDREKEIDEVLAGADGPDEDYAPAEEPPASQQYAETVIMPAENGEEDDQDSDVSAMFESSRNKRRRSSLLIAIPFILVALAAGVIYKYWPTFSQLTDQIERATGTPNQAVTGETATLVTRAEAHYDRREYEECKKVIIDSDMQDSPEVKELLSACRIMSDPSAVYSEKPQPSWTKGLVDLLQSNVSWRTRQIAARKLGDLNDPRSIAALSAILLEDKDWGVRCEAADSLAKLGEPSVLDTLKRSYQEDPENIVRIASKQAISKLEKTGAGHGGSQTKIQ